MSAKIINFYDYISLKYNYNGNIYNIIDESINYLFGKDKSGKYIMIDKNNDKSCYFDYVGDILYIDEFLQENSENIINNFFSKLFSKETLEWI